MKFTYLLINFLTVLIPFIYSFHPKIKFYKQWKSFLMAAVVVALIFISWDAYFTARGVWNFNPKYLIGLNIFGLPIEEILFFICIPFACVFTYFCLNKFWNLKWKKRTETIVCLSLAAVLFIIGVAHINQVYTSFTFISTAAICLLLEFVLKVDFFSKALTTYAVLLIPFLIVNGLLTGSGLAEPVVSYNNDENLGIRILTIPIEDAVYGFELFLLNIYFFHLFRRQSYHTSERLSFT